MSHEAWLTAIRTGTPTSAAIEFALSGRPAHFEFWPMSGATVHVTLGTATTDGRGGFLASYRVTLHPANQGDSKTFEGLDFEVPSMSLIGTCNAALQLLTELGTNNGVPELCAFVAEERAANDVTPWPSR